MQLSQQQSDALKLVETWYQANSKKEFRLFGFAGTGKSTIATYFADKIKEAEFVTFTGKAAQVLKQKGISRARTIHSLIYNAIVPNPDQDPDDDAAQEVIFQLKPKDRLKDVPLLVVDECSMIDKKIANDLRSFDIPMLLLGDPMQLPPIAGDSAFMQEEPDFQLTEIFRQAKDNPIIELSDHIRKHGKLWQKRDCESLRMIPKYAFDDQLLLRADQILVGTNKTAARYNDKIRELKGYHDQYPMVGEKLLCKRSAGGFINGSLWQVKKRYDKYESDKLGYQVVSLFDEAQTQHFQIPKRAFDRQVRYTKSDHNAGYQFDYGYAMTLHKAQGSQWDKVVVFDESQFFFANKQKWLYTAVTRAAKELVLVI